MNTKPIIHEDISAVAETLTKNINTLRKKIAQEKAKIGQRVETVNRIGSNMFAISEEQSVLLGKAIRSLKLAILSGLSPEKSPLRALEDDIAQVVEGILLKSPFEPREPVSSDDLKREEMEHDEFSRQQGATASSNQDQADERADETWEEHDVEDEDDDFFRRAQEEFIKVQRAQMERERLRDPFSPESLAKLNQSQVPGDLDVRRTYLQLTKLVHPDLARDPAERERRTAMMQDLALAYKSGDFAAMLQIQDDIVLSRPPAPVESAADTAPEEVERLRAHKERLEEQLKSLKKHSQRMTRSKRWKETRAMEGSGQSELDEMVLTCSEICRDAEELAEKITAVAADRLAISNLKKHLKRLKRTYLSIDDFFGSLFEFM